MLRKENKQWEQLNDHLKLDIATIERNSQVLEAYLEARARARGDGHSHGDEGLPGLGE